VEPVIPTKLEEGRDAIIAISDRVGRVQDFHKVAAAEFQSTLNFGLMEVVYEWAKGMVRLSIWILTEAKMVHVAI
jgi:antiviral helicase SKI2